MQEHIVSAFEQELNNLSKKISQMGNLSKNQLTIAMKALENNDCILAKKAIISDQKIDKLELKIEEEAVLMIAKRQPMALDLRRIIVTIRISSDLERIGDLAKNIAKRVINIKRVIPVNLIDNFDLMNKLVQKSLKDILDAFNTDNVNKAINVWKNDKNLDILYNNIFIKIKKTMKKNTDNIDYCTHLQFVAKDIERIGDHITNISENIYYMMCGELFNDNCLK